MYKIYSVFIVFLFASANIFQTGNVITDTQFKFIGTKACKKCHIKEYKSWIETKMAKAYDLLKPGERSDAKKKGRS